MKVKGKTFVYDKTEISFYAGNLTKEERTKAINEMHYVLPGIEVNADMTDDQIQEKIDAYMAKAENFNNFAQNSGGTIEMTKTITVKFSKNTLTINSTRKNEDQTTTNEETKYYYLTNSKRINLYEDEDKTLPVEGSSVLIIKGKKLLQRYPIGYGLIVDTYFKQAK